MLSENIAGIATGGAIAFFGSLASRTRLDWNVMRYRIKLVDTGSGAAVDDPASDPDADEATLRKAFKFSIGGGGHGNYADPDLGVAHAALLCRVRV